ncbi:PRC-barrel domain-containing protein [Paracoccus laeviglucosivorans]|uniref:PRC-barrel domain-containing protein n=1 Tax=Paracoccus laeviglucosivorans TaxID=1197861 RepID=A0A521CRX1_9RHOB|nr:PRC-barrel domain-containing protein [Paracoccus laeviglucosivorans]SMO62166.1 PRC-barrel domain-containing protein [Paracoccus laeviglucosivorans]
MKPFVIAATTLALALPAVAQTTAPATPPATAAPADQAEGAAATAETAADNAEAAAEKAADEAGAAAEQAADEAANAADQAADAAATAADDAANAAQGMGDQAGDAAAAADNAEDAASDAADSAADAAADAPDSAAAPAGEAAAPPVTPPDVNPPAISEADPGLLGTWITSRRIWTTNQPSTQEWSQPEELEERPAEWQDIAKVNDIVLDDSGQVVGYIADIGGFLGIGAKKVLLGVDAIHMVSVGTDTFFATNYTKAELEALPDFDEKTVRK